MTASLQVKNGIWQMVFSYKDSSGKWRQKSESTGLAEKANKRKAKLVLDERLREVAKEIESMIKDRTQTFSAEMEKWLQDVMLFEVRSNTLSQYMNVWKKHICTFEPFNDLPISKITPTLLQAYVNTKAKAGLSAETIRKHHANIHKFLDYCWKLELIPNNPADKIELPKRNRQQRGQVYSAEQVLQLIELFKGDPRETLILITATYGMRRSEICGLKWDAIDFENNCLYIRHTAIVDIGKVVYSDNTKSDSSRRRLPLTQTVMEHLKTIKGKQSEDQNKIGSAYKNDGFVCCWDNGSPLLPEYVTRHYKKVLQENSFPFIQLRNLRDTSATLLYQGGFDAKSIQRWLGHADASTTANIYIHLRNQDLDSMATAMDQTIYNK